MMFKWIKRERKELPLFNSTKECRACGCRSMERKYVPLVYTEFGYSLEHIEAICMACGYPNPERLLCE